MGISFRLFYKLMYVRNSCFLHFFFGPKMMANPTLVDDKENTSNSSGKHGKGKFVQQLGELEDARTREDCLSLAFFGVAIFYILASAHPATEAIGDDASFSLFLVPYIVLIFMRKIHDAPFSLKKIFFVI